jgi:penicillin amidase
MEALRRLLSRALLVGRGPATRGRILVPGLAADAEILRDRWGIPHIRAASAADLFFAQGFVHAQDRLWQMHIMRRLTSGRLSEFAGSSTLLFDLHCRMLGLPEMKRRAFEALDDDERALLCSYTAGVNACVAGMKKLPVELTALSPPEPWTPLDCLSTLPYLSWILMFSQFAEKLLAVSRADSLDRALWNEIFPSHPGAILPDDDWFDRVRGMRFGPLHPGALGFHSGLSGDRSTSALTRILLSLSPGPGGSNNWAVARSEDGLPLLANDPHLGASLPAVWYFCHLEVPGDINAAGASLAGAPGLVIGRNEHAAWAVTNVMLDAADILTFRVDPADPLRYFIGNRELRMREVPQTVGLPRGASVTIPLYLTDAGPVVTRLEPGVTGAAVLKWYGTLGDAELVDRSFPASLDMLKASSAASLLDLARGWQYTAQNFVAADDAGHIGWHATGAAPIRRGYSGRLPGDGSAGADWAGFHPYESLPHSMDPGSGWIATANHRPDAPGSPVLSHVWFGPWRVRRIGQLLAAIDRPRPRDFQRMQMDVHSLQADLLVPKIAALPLASPPAREAVAILSAWDREARSDSAGAAIFEVFLTELTRALLSGPLGDDLDLYLNARTYGPENEIFDRPASPLWPAAPARVVEEALVRTMAFCQQRMGRTRRRWSWGRLHTYAFRHPGASRNRTLSWLLNPAPRSAGGDADTINASAPSVSRDSYHATAIPSLRMIVPLGDPDGMLIIGPLGQSGQPGHRHYDDMIDPWIRGELAPLPLTRAGVEKVTRERLVLAPAPDREHALRRDQPSVPA